MCTFAVDLEKIDLFMARNILLLLLLIPLCCFAQNDRGKVSTDTLQIENASDSVLSKQTDAAEEALKCLVESYQDSLRMLRQQLDAEWENRLSQYRFAAHQPLDGKYASLFIPLNYDPMLAYRRFSFDDGVEELALYRHNIDDALLNQYIYHTDNVNNALKAKKDPGKKTDEVQPSIYVPKAEIAFPSIPQADEAKAHSTNLVITKPNFWKFTGDYYLQFVQNHYSKNWYQGGESNYTVESRNTIQLNYNNKQKVKFENKLEMNLGFRTNKTDTIHPVKTSSDLLRYTGKLGIQASKKWYYTLQAVGSSQFMRSFATNSDKVNSDFLSPLTVNVSLGMDYTIDWFKGKLKGTAHLAPFAINYKYCDRDELVSNHGIDVGKHGKLDKGSTLTLDTNWKFSNSVSWKSRLYGYTTYERVDLQWENTINLKVSKLISANIYLYPRFDDSNIKRKDRDLGYFQLKEYMSLGFSYSMY